ncbi:MAG TPA: Ig domain-containing protein, partial [Nitrospirota bacterium]
MAKNEGMSLFDRSGKRGGAGADMNPSNKSLQHVFIIITAIMTAITAALPAQVHAAMGSYCIMPPYVKRDIRPNVMIMMDNSADMGDPAYCTKSATFSTDHLCTDSYNLNQAYTGYFKPGLKYSYSGGRWVPDPNGAYSGNLLNWLTTSKYDLLENILVGGISTSRQTNVNTLISKSNTWQKSITYIDSLGAPRTCVFNVNSANVSVSDPAGQGGACGYLDTPAHPIPNDPGAGVSFVGPDERYAWDWRQQDHNYPVGNPVNSHVSKTPGFLPSILSAVLDFLVPPAEAASFHISGGSGSLSSGAQCMPYSFSLAASGGTGNGYTWSISAGSLPPGLSIGVISTPTTTISGIPTASGIYTFTVQARDSGGNTDTKNYSITVNAAKVTISPSLTSPLQDGYVGTYYLLYQNTAVISACSSTYIWQVSSGAMPPGLSLSSDPGGDLWISGYPSTAGTYNFTLQVQDSQNNTASRSFSLTIYPAPSQIQITTGSPLQGGTAGQFYYSYIFTPPSSPGGYPFTWSITSGSLPPGMYFWYWGSDNVGQWSYAEVYGTPTAAGTYTFTVQVIASIGQVTSKTFTLTIAPNPNPVRTTGNLNVQVCTGNYTYNCTTTLPVSSPPTSLADWTAAGCSTSNLTQCILKSGLVDQFWPQARFGVMDFNKSQSIHAVPNVGVCIQNCTDLPRTDPGYCPAPSSNFMTAVENAVAIDPVTTLVNGEYE